jgi:opacity protein-like surface antigen
MKRRTLLFIFFIWSLNSFGQAFDSDTRLWNIAASLGAPFWGNLSKSPVSIQASYERAAGNNISIGAGITFSQAKDTGNNIKYTGYYFAAKLSIHFATTDKFDPYSGLSVGYTKVNADDKNFIRNADINYQTSSNIGWGTYLGVRYYIGEEVALNIEAGYGSFAILSGGISINF